MKHTVVLLEDGSVWTWGNNSLGQLGLDVKSTKEPQKVMNGIKQIEASWGNSFAIDYDGTLWGWGANHDKEIDNSNDGKIKHPVKMMEHVRFVHNQGGTTSVINRDGRLFTRGAFPAAYSLQCDSKGFAFISDYVVSASSSGENHLFFVKSDGSLLAMGKCSFGYLGCGPDCLNATEPLKVLDGVKMVACERLGSGFAIRSDNTLWGWGQNNCICRQIDGKVVPCEGTIYYPIQLFDHVTDMVASDGTLMFLRENGEAWGMGYSYDTKNQGVCRIIEHDVAKIFKAPEHYGVIKKNGDVLVWELTGSQSGFTYPKQKPILLAL